MRVILVVEELDEPIRHSTSTPRKSIKGLAFRYCIEVGADGVNEDWVLTQMVESGAFAEIDDDLTGKV